MAQFIEVNPYQAAPTLVNVDHIERIAYRVIEDKNHVVFAAVLYLKGEDGSNEKVRLYESYELIIRMLASNQKILRTGMMSFREVEIDNEAYFIDAIKEV
jgi:hypothetical protein